MEHRPSREKIQMSDGKREFTAMTELSGNGPREAAGRGADRQRESSQSDIEPREPKQSLLACVLARCAEEEGGNRALARALGISPQTLHELLRDLRRPGRHVARAIADYLVGAPSEEEEVSPDDVIAWSSAGA